MGPWQARVGGQEHLGGVPQAEDSEYYRQIRRAMEEGITTEFETISSVLGIWIAGRAYPSREGLSVYFQDVTDRKHAEVERARLAAIVESSDDVILSKTLEGIITSWNKGAERIYGYTAEEVVGQPVSMLVPPERPNEIPEILQRIQRGEKVDHFETVRMTKDGRRLDISLTVSPIRNSEGEIVGASTIARDITERKRAEEAMRQVREAERRRLARDLHDGVLQDLSYTAASMELIMLDAGDTSLGKELQRAVYRVRRAGQELREAVNDLRLADEVGLPFPDLVESLVRRNRARARGLEISLEVGKTEGGDLVAGVSDDGRGFEPGTTPGVGLNSMRERAEVIGGELEIASQPGRGTSVRLRVPLPERTE
jgi:PAS domain S-box-containing protein